MSASQTTHNARRCLLFVPGIRPERFDKALASGADQVCLDLEDAVPPGDKDAARQLCFEFLGAPRSARCEVGLRINVISSDFGRRDLRELIASGLKPAFVMLPKVELPDEVRVAIEALAPAQVPIIAQLESPTAIFEARAIARAGAGHLQALMFGGYDYAIAARCTPGWDAWLWARAQLVAAAAEAEVGAIDVPSLELNDAAQVADETRRVLALGFTAKSAIHPAQVASIQAAFVADRAAVERARRIVAAAEGAGGAAVAIDGKLVDRPVELAARRTLALAAQSHQE